MVTGLHGQAGPVTPRIICQRCGYLADFYFSIIRQHEDEEPRTDFWCWRCVSGQDEDE